MATTKLAASLASAKAHARHVWRDTPPTNADGTINAYIEIARGDRNKYEFDMGRNQRAIDRVVPEKIGGYVVNYGFVPQTVLYDGDPFDALVLGPPIDGGTVVRGVIVGLFLMEDEKGHDGKVVLSRTDAAGKPVHALTAESKKEMDDYFSRYKEGQPGLFSKVGGWGSIRAGPRARDRDARILHDVPGSRRHDVCAVGRSPWLAGGRARCARRDGRGRDARAGRPRAPRVGG